MRSYLENCSCGKDPVATWTASDGHMISCPACGKTTGYHKTYDAAKAEWEKLNAKKN